VPVHVLLEDRLNHRGGSRHDRKADLGHVQREDIVSLADFYAKLAGWKLRFVEEGWITLATDDGWRIGLEAVPYHVRPRWPDPAYPQQGHFDLRVRDLNGATERAIELGATRLGGDGMWHTLADPAGHPFDLCRSANEADMTIHAITIDAPNASALGAFYAELLGLPVSYEGDDEVLLGGDLDRRVMIQQVQGPYAPPRWPDPAYPQQCHLDVTVGDLDEAEPRALAAGATRLSAGGPYWRVFADPAGHPFCLLVKPEEDRGHY
jgi:catechol 2,3-dioxygenase-like lactoylglutathione lyase family enzyme